MPTIIDRFKGAWNAFVSNRDPTWEWQNFGGMVTSYRPDRMQFTRGNQRSIVTSLYNRIALDVAAVDIRHIRLDTNGRYTETIDSDLNRCLNADANLDQTGRAMIQDLVMSMFDEGCIAVVPTRTEDDPVDKEAFKIYELRVGRIMEWRPHHVRVRLYNEDTGLKEEVTLPKHMVAIIENPLYAVMNEPNATLNRLVRKINLLDVIDDQSGSGKLDVIIQLPYALNSDRKRIEAKRRKKDIEDQLVNSKYGIAYIDGTEHITQLNRPVENNLLKQVEMLTEQLYGQLGMSKAIFDGTAKEEEMLNYNNRTIEPILSAIVEEMRRKFLTKTARSQGQSISFFRDPFRLVPVSQMAEIADKFTRNEIMTANEIRQVIGMKPSKDPNADVLRNKNLSEAKVVDDSVMENVGEFLDEFKDKPMEEIQNET